MKPGSHVSLVSAVRMFAPLIALFALSLLATRAPGSGAGLAAGATFALALVFYALVFGAEALRAAFPPLALRLALVTGVVLALAGAGFPGLPLAPQLVEAGAAFSAGAALTLGALVLFGRVPTLRDAER